jgi:hypothetical protein
MKQSIENLIESYKQAGPCKDFLTQLSYERKIVSTAESYDELYKAYLMFSPVMTDSFSISVLKQKLLDSAKEYEQLKWIYHLAYVKKEKEFAAQIKEKLYSVAGILELETFYYWATVINEHYTVKQDEANKKEFKKEVIKVAVKKLPLIGKLF